jgi:hypothetical protein
LRVGRDTAGASYLFGHIQQIGIWNGFRAPNSNLIDLT